MSHDTRRRVLICVISELHTCTEGSRLGTHSVLATPAHGTVLAGIPAQWGLINNKNKRNHHAEKFL